MHRLFPRRHSVQSTNRLCRQHLERVNRAAGERLEGQQSTTFDALQKLQQELLTQHTSPRIGLSLHCEENSDEMHPIASTELDTKHLPLLASHKRQPVTLRITGPEQARTLEVRRGTDRLGSIPLASGQWKGDLIRILQLHVPGLALDALGAEEYEHAHALETAEERTNLLTRWHNFPADSENVLKETRQALNMEEEDVQVSTATLSPGADQNPLTHVTLFSAEHPGTILATFDVGKSPADGPQADITRVRSFFHRPSFEDVPQKALAAYVQRLTQVQQPLIDPLVRIERNEQRATLTLTDTASNNAQRTDIAAVVIDTDGPRGVAVITRVPKGARSAPCACTPRCALRGSRPPSGAGRRHPPPPPRAAAGASRCTSCPAGNRP